MGLFDVGDDEGGTSFLANLHNQQRKLDNLGPSKAGDHKSTAVQKPPSQVKKAGRFTLADEDEDDFFAEFDVDLDMDGDLAPPKQPLSNIPENSSDVDLNPTSDSAADETAAEASSAPMVTIQLESGPASPDAAPQVADDADGPSAADSATDMDTVTQTCGGQAKTATMASPTQSVHCEYAAAVMEDAAVNIGSTTGHEAVHNAGASAGTSRPAPLPLLTQLEDESMQAQSNDAHAVVGHLAGEGKGPQLQDAHATAQPTGAAATAQPADGHESHPAQALSTGQSGNANPPPHSACDQSMNAAANQHAPSQQADTGADTSSDHELADGGATTQLVHGIAATELAQGTEPEEPAGIEPVTDEGAIPMQTESPTSTGQERPLADRHDQPSQLQAMVGVEAPKNAQTQAELQRNTDHTAGAQHSTQSETMEKMQLDPDHPALDVAGSDAAMLDSEMVDTNTPLEASTTDAAGTLPGQQGIGSTSVMGSLDDRLAQLDTDMEDASSHGDQQSDHQMPEGDPVGRDFGPSKLLLAAASEAGDQSEVGCGHAQEPGRSPARQAPPSSPAGLQIGTLEQQAASARPAAAQRDRASEPAEASLPPSKTATPDTSQAVQPTAIARQAQGISHTGASIPSHTATSSAVAGSVSKPSNQPPTAGPALPASPSIQKCTPLLGAKTVLTPLAMASDKAPFKPAAASPLTSFAGRAVSSSPQTSLTPISLHKPLLPISRSTGQAGTGKAMSLSNARQSSTHRTAGMSNVIPNLGKVSLVKSSKDNAGQQNGGKFAAPSSTRPLLPQLPAKPASKATGTFPSLFKQHLSASSGSAQLAATDALGPPPAHATLPAPSSKAPGLPKPTSKPTAVVRAAPTVGASPVPKPVTLAASMPSSGRPLSGQDIHATSSQHVSERPHISKQAAKLSEQSLHSRGPAAPDAQTLADTIPGGPAARGSNETDTVMEEEVQRRLADPKPWTSTSLTAGLMGSMKNLEEMLLEIQQMHDDVLEHKVNVAISSNRLTRLDNPIIHDKLRSLKKQAETIFQTAGMEE